MSWENGGTERDILGVGQDISIRLKLFWVLEIYFLRRPHRVYNLDLRVSVKKQISMITADNNWSWGTQRTNNKSWFVFICVTTQSWLRLAVCCKIQEMYIFTFNKIYLYSRKHFSSSNYIFMELQGIVIIQLHGNEIVAVNFQGNILIQKTYTYSQNIYSFKEIIFVQRIIFISRKLYLFIQWNYIHSTTLRSRT